MKKLVEVTTGIELNRAELLEALRPYFESLGLGDSVRVEIEVRAPNSHECCPNESIVVGDESPLFIDYTTLEEE